jgi:hypothetical protein
MTRTFWRKTYLYHPFRATSERVTLIYNSHSLAELIKAHGKYLCERYELVTESVTKFTFKELKQLDQEGVTPCEEATEQSDHTH